MPDHVATQPPGNRLPGNKFWAARFAPRKPVKPTSRTQPHPMLDGKRLRGGKVARQIRRRHRSWPFPPALPAPQRLAADGVADPSMVWRPTGPDPQQEQRKRKAAKRVAKQSRRRNRRRHPSSDKVR